MKINKNSQTLAILATLLASCGVPPDDSLDRPETPDATPAEINSSAHECDLQRLEPIESVLIRIRQFQHGSLSLNLNCVNLQCVTLCESRLDLSGANLAYASLHSANLTGVYLGGTNLYGAFLQRANLTRAGLSSANLENANLTSANLENARLIEANLENANLARANLTSAEIQYANLGGANLTGANLYLANLTHANLRGANLQGAYLAVIIGRLNNRDIIITTCSDLCMVHNLGCTC